MLSKKTDIILKNAGIIWLRPVKTSVKAMKVIDSTAIDAVILDADLDPAVVVPVIALLEERAIPFIFAIRPIWDGKTTAGFVLSDRNNDMLRIGNNLFPAAYKGPREHSLTQ
ncbi:hypothetical protein Brsp06_04933 [Brucella sp. NBRC 13694]|uniref:transcriptional regulator n=1 Tax=Brucella sp. NBRC 13694 TaxID=3075482 RepID=UPI0028A6F832|nr:transcriptional regulator [Brucella anthropi]